MKPDTTELCIAVKKIIDSIHFAQHERIESIEATYRRDEGGEGIFKEVTFVPVINIKMKGGKND